MDNFPDDLKEKMEDEKTDYMEMCESFTNSTQVEFLTGTAACISNPWFQKSLVVLVAIAVNLIGMSK